MSNRSVFIILNTLFLVQWVLLGLHVHSRSAWILENILVAAFAIPVVWAYQKKYISLTSYIMIVLFAMLHNLGAHYTYSLVPYDKWIHSLTGTTLNEMLGWKRNQFDRLIHFLFGALALLPFRELGKKSGLRGWWVNLMPIVVVAAISACYELMEWAAAVAFSDGAGQAYVGTQGDEWDAQKDQALAIAGALISFVLYALVESARGFGAHRRAASRHFGKLKAVVR